MMLFLPFFFASASTSGGAWSLDYADLASAWENLEFSRPEGAGGVQVASRFKFS
jgi:hypothetical protein